MPICKAHDFLRNEAHTSRSLLFFPGKPERGPGTVPDCEHPVKDSDISGSHSYMILSHLNQIG